MWGQQSERNAPCQGCQGWKGRGGVPRETKPTNTEPHLRPITAACPACVACFIKAHRCAPHLHTYTHAAFSLSPVFTCELSVVTSCWSAHMLASALICSCMLSSSPRRLLEEGVVLTADSGKGVIVCWRTEVKQVIGSGDGGAGFSSALELENFAHRDAV